MKDIFNAIFYYDKKTGKKNTLFIYDDGSIRLTSYEEGMMVCTNYAKHKNNSNDESFDPEFISVISKKELLKKFSSILPDNILDSIKNDSISESISSNLSSGISEDDVYNVTEKIDHIDFITLSNLDIDVDENISSRKRHMFSFKPSERDDYLSKNRFIAKHVNFDSLDKEDELDNSDDSIDLDINFNPIDSDNIDLSTESEPIDLDTINDIGDENDSINLDDANISSDNFDLDERDYSENSEDTVDSNDSELPAKKGRSKFIIMLSFILALSIVIGTYLLTKRSKDSVDNTNSISTKDQLNEDDNHLNSSISNELDPFKQMINNTNSTVQKNVMSNLAAFLNYFNSAFANGYIEKGKDVKACLSFDEMVALMCAYNDYSKDDIKAIFNGADIDSSVMSRDYKNASLQLMGSYIIETKNYPLDISHIIESEEGKDFYNKYHRMFLNAKYAKGSEKERLVKDFFDSVRSDFPVTNDVRTEGIAHADKNELDSYKLAVTPMIAAAEMIFKDFDYSLDNTEIDFLNDIGLCNQADHKFERIETIVLSSNVDEKNPLYDDFRNIIIKMLKDNNKYVIDDSHRDLSKLDTFKLAVNGRFDEVLEGDFICVTTYSTESYTSYYEDITRTEKEMPQNIKSQIDAEIDADNNESKRQGEDAAEENRRSIQAAEDRNADRVNSEIDIENKDLDKRIDDANSGSDNINEDDFGNHGVDFDDNYSDSDGNLDKSVENITTDPGGDQSNEPLPDPNVTGADFDNRSFASTGVSLNDYIDYIIEYYTENNNDTDANNYQYIK